jgi:hypothetical protein
MDISDELQGGFLKVEDCRNELPRRDIIQNVTRGRFGPDMELRGGGILTLNKTNLRKLAQAWGPETDDWLGREIELYLGETEYQGEKRESILVRNISAPTPWRDRERVQADRDLHSDEIPF